MASNSTDTGGDDLTLAEYYVLFQAQAIKDPTWYASIAMYAMMAMPLLYILFTTCRRIKGKPTPFLLLMLMQNVSALWFTLYAVYSLSNFYLVPSWPRLIPSALAQLSNELLFFGRLAVFRIFYPWFSERVERWSKIVLFVIWLGVFWLNLLWIFVDYGVLDVGPAYMGSQYSLPDLISIKAQVSWIILVMVTEASGTFLIVRSLIRHKMGMQRMFGHSSISSKAEKSTQLKTPQTKSTQSVANDSQAPLRCAPSLLENTTSTAPTTGAGGPGATSAGGTDDTNRNEQTARMARLKIQIVLCLALMVVIDVLIVIWSYLSSLLPSDSPLRYLGSISGALTTWHYTASATAMYLITALWKA